MNFSFQPRLNSNRDKLVEAKLARESRQRSNSREGSSHFHCDGMKPKDSEAEELKECFFRPKINLYRAERSAYSSLGWNTQA